MEITQDLDAINAKPFVPLWSSDAFFPEPSEGIYKYSADVGSGSKLEALFVNKRAETLIVSMHGALQRSTIRLPRFERLRTFLRTDYSSIYFGDPALHLSEDLSLSWFTGWREVNVPHLIADWVQKAAHASGASRVLLIGSSGGGFASGQVSALVPKSIAIVFNPQTVISAYRPKGSLGYGRAYIRNVMPDLTPEGGLKAITAQSDWAVPLGDRGSMISRYSRETPNKLLYVQNDQDLDHWRDHYLPFRSAVEYGDNALRTRFTIYSGPEGHSAPPKEVFQGSIEEALRWVD